MRRVWRLFPMACLATLMILGGCGGGSGSGNGGSASGGGGSGSAPATPATKAIVRLSSQGTLPQGTQLSGLSVTLRLPAGVSVSTDANGAVASGAVTLSGVAAQGGSDTLLPPVYTPASSTGLATLELTFAGSPFGTGEFATIVCDLAPGSAAPGATSLVVSNFSPADQLLRPVTSLSVALTLQLE